MSRFQLRSRCSCDKPHSGANIPKPGAVVDLGQDPNEPNAEAANVVTCQRCGRLWLRYRLEDSWVSRSNRWYRVQVDHMPERHQVTSLIESAEYCYAGGEYHRPADATGEIPRLADGTKRTVEGFRWNRPITVR